MRKRLSLSGFLAHEISALGKQIVPLLDVYGQEQYEAGYRDGMNKYASGDGVDVTSPEWLERVKARARRRG